MKPKTPGRARLRRHNREQDPVEVYCRVRPIDANLEKCCTIASPTELQILPPEGSQAYKNGQYKEMHYTYQYVFDEAASQKAVFDHVAMPLVEDLLLGKNGLLFTYGITSSGKTHTMTGSAREQGVLPRTLDVLFNSIAELQAKKYVFMPDKMNGFDVQSEADAMIERQRRDIMPKLIGSKTPGRGRYRNHNLIDDFPADEFELDGERVKEPTALDCVEEDNNYAVFVSYVEIYNNYIYDLLEELPYDPITGFKAPQSKILREDANGNMYVHNCTETEVKSTEEAYDVLVKGQKRRKVAHTALNAESSRSHSVFNVRVVQAPLDVMGQEVLQQKDRVTTSQLSLVDLAGSERLSRTKNSGGDRIREAGNINQSLMALRTCIEYLRENQNGSNKMVPYRDSRLTHLFKNYFDGEGKVRMIVCVNPNAEEYDETLQVMRFAEMTQEIMVTRADAIQQDPGLFTGRRRMAREQAEKMEVEQEDVALRIYDLGPPFPDTLLTQPQNDVVLTSLLQHLQTRELTREHLVADLARRQDTFRSQLLDIEEENRGLHQRVKELENLVDSRSTDKTRMERKVRSLEKQLNEASGLCKQLELENRELRATVDSTSDCVKRERTEKHRLKDEHASKLRNLNRQWEDALARQRQQTESEASSRLLAKDRKLKLVKSIIDGSSEGSDAEPGRGRARGPMVAPKPARSRLGLPARSDTSLNTCGTTTPTTSSGASRPFRPGTRLNNRMKSPPPAPKPVPVVNPRHHRRSRSHGDDLWIDHRSNKNVDLNTVLQPKMKKKKSVTELRQKDTRDASKYCLTHQLQDSDGELRTQLYKGDVLPTAGGGTAVIFNDVETLRQSSPGDRKRRPSSQRPEDFDGEWTDTETRCHIAIEGHQIPKRSRTQVHV